MTARQTALAALQARAAACGRRVYGFGSGKASCGELLPKKPVPAEWTHFCVEGDVAWTWVGTDEESQGAEAA